MPASRSRERGRRCAASSSASAGSTAPFSTWPRLGLGRFDYISCLGVLHPLADPDHGLRALVQVLSDDGALALMVYGRYGRLDVYAVQDLMRLINRDAAELPEQIANLKAALRGLSPAHLLLRGRRREQIEAMIANEANLADTFLHVQDRAYTVPELYRLVEGAGMSVVNFTNFGRVVRLEYEPDVYLSDPVLKNRLAARPVRERQAIAELLHGHMFLHTFYAARPGREAASFRDPEMVPFFLTRPGAEAAEKLRDSGAVKVQLSSRITLAVEPSPAALACLRLVDGVRPLADIWRSAGAALGEDAGQSRGSGGERPRALQRLQLALPAPPLVPAAAVGGLRLSPRRAPGELTRKAHRGPGIPPRELEAEIARLRSDLYFTRRAIIDLAPAKTQDLLNSYFQKCKTRADVRSWTSDLVKSLIALADARPAKEMGDYAGTHGPRRLPGLRRERGQRVRRARLRVPGRPAAAPRGLGRHPRVRSHEGRQRTGHRIRDRPGGRKRP